MKKFITLILLAGVAFCFSASISYASFTVGMTGELTTGDSEIIVTGTEWVKDGVPKAISLSWNVVDNLDGTFTYTYTWDGPEEPFLSHLDIQVSEDFSDTDLVSWSVSPSESPSYEIGFFDGTGWKAFKFDDLGNSKVYTLILTTNRMPMDGGFWAKAAGGDDDASTAYNAESSFMAVPNSLVPIPSAIFLLGTGLIGIVGLRKKFRER